MSEAEKKQIEKYLGSPQVLADWGISQAHRYSSIFAVAHTALLALMLGVSSYFLSFNGFSITAHSVRGLVIAVALVALASFLRVFQLRAEINELPEFCKELAFNFVGIESHDNDVIVGLERVYPWKSSSVRVIEHMLGLGGIALLIIDLCQAGMGDPVRSSLFYLAVLAFIAGGCWVHFSFREALSTAELEERCKASFHRRRRQL